MKKLLCLGIFIFSFFIMSFGCKALDFGSYGYLPNGSYLADSGAGDYHYIEVDEGIPFAIYTYYGSNSSPQYDVFCSLSSTKTTPSTNTNQIWRSFYDSTVFILDNMTGNFNYMGIKYQLSINNSFFSVNNNYYTKTISNVSSSLFPPNINVFPYTSCMRISKDSNNLITLIYANVMSGDTWGITYSSSFRPSSTLNSFKAYANSYILFSNVDIVSSKGLFVAGEYSLLKSANYTPILPNVYSYDDEIDTSKYFEVSFEIDIEDYLLPNDRLNLNGAFFTTKNDDGTDSYEVDSYLDSPYLRITLSDGNIIMIDEIATHDLFTSENGWRILTSRLLYYEQSITKVELVFPFEGVYANTFVRIKFYSNFPISNPKFVLNEDIMTDWTYIDLTTKYAVVFIPKLTTQNSFINRSFQLLTYLSFKFQLWDNDEVIRYDGVNTTMILPSGMFRFPVENFFTKYDYILYFENNLYFEDNTSNVGIYYHSDFFTYCVMDSPKTSCVVHNSNTGEDINFNGIDNGDANTTINLNIIFTTFQHFVLPISFIFHQVTYFINHMPTIVQSYITLIFTLGVSFIILRMLL